MAPSRLTGKQLKNSRGHTKNDVVNGTGQDLSWYGFSSSDIAWVKTGSRMWWPAQITDEESMFGSSKPRKKAGCEVLVRLYGTYNYLYINPLKYNLELENAIKQNNGNVKELLKKALQKDLSHIKSCCEVKGTLSPTKELTAAEVPKDVQVQERIEGSEEKKMIAHVKKSLFYRNKRKSIKERKKARNARSAKKLKKQYNRRQECREEDRNGTPGQKNNGCVIDRLKDFEKAGIVSGGRKPKTNFSGKLAVDSSEMPEDMNRQKSMEHLLDERTGREVKQNRDRRTKKMKQDVEHDKVKERKMRKRLANVISDRGIDERQKLLEQRASIKRKQLPLAGKGIVVDQISLNHALSGNTPDASARRTKVMRSLGLVAPHGSPF